MSTHRMIVNFQDLPVIPQVLYITHSKYEKDWGTILHSHAFTEFIFIESGKGEICTQTQTYPVEKKDFIVLLPNLMHTERSSPDEPLEYYVLGVSNMMFEAYHDDPSSFYPILELGNITDKVRSLLVTLYHEMHTQRSGYELMVGSIYLQFTVLLMRHMKIDFSFTESHNMRREIAYAKNYIDKHYMENLSLEEIAEQSYLSKFHLVREFCRYIGFTPMAYLTERRIIEAKMLLSSTNMTILDISNEVGFSSSSYFSQRFKASCGMTPLRYRQNSYLKELEKTLEHDLLVET